MGVVWWLIGVVVTFVVIAIVLLIFPKRVIIGSKKLHPRIFRQVNPPILINTVDDSKFKGFVAFNAYRDWEKEDTPNSVSLILIPWDTRKKKLGWEGNDVIIHHTFRREDLRFIAEGAWSRRRTIIIHESNANSMNEALAKSQLGIFLEEARNVESRAERKVTWVQEHLDMIYETYSLVLAGQKGVDDMMSMLGKFQKEKPDFENRMEEKKHE